MMIKVTNAFRDLEGCDPRGPLAVYFMVALLIRFKTELLAEKSVGSPEVFLNVLRRHISHLLPGDISKICDDSKLIRASTPLNIIDQAFACVSPTKHKEEESTGYSWMSMRNRMKLTLGIGSQAAGVFKIVPPASRVGEFISIVNMKDPNQEPMFSDEESEGAIEEDPNERASEEELNDTATENCNEDQIIAKSRMIICGLVPGSKFTPKLFDRLGKQWSIIPVFKSSELRLLLLVHHRVMYLASSDKVSLRSTLSKTGVSSFSKDTVAELLKATSLVVKHCFHVSQIVKIVFRPSDATGKQDTKFYLNDGHSIRFRVHCRYTRPIAKYVMDTVVEMHGLLN